MLVRARLFRRDKVLSRNTHRPSGLAFTLRKKFLGVPRSVFSKTLLGREWDRVPQREGEPAIGARLFRRDKVLSRNAHRPSGFTFTHSKKFLRIPRGVFSKTLLGREWDSVPQRESEPNGVRLFRRDKVPARNTPDCPASPLRPKKVFEGSKGRFFKNAPWQGVGQGPTKRG